jgi:hypothetical protein
MSSRRCTNCGAIAPTNARYCPDCGAPFTGTPGDRVPPRNDWNPSIWVAMQFGFGFAIGASLLGIALFLILSILGLALVNVAPGR